MVSKGDSKSKTQAGSCGDDRGSGIFENKAQGYSRPDGETMEPAHSSAAIRPGHYGQIMATSMTQEEFNKVHSDVYGKPPPDIERMEQRVADLEREIGHLPKEKKSSVLRALRYNPLLFVSSAHTNLFLQSEEFDARDGAVRMARYWERREQMFGERAFTSEVFKNPTREDYLRYYQRSMQIAEDPDADETMRAVARHYVENVRKAKIVAMDVILEKTPRHERAALLDAQSRSPELAASDEHKLLFLHCEDFYEAKAAERMIRYWEEKRVIFGQEYFHRRILLEDLEGRVQASELSRRFESAKELSSGVWRLMPCADDHGRSVVVISFSRLSHDTVNQESLDAVAWYVLHCALEKPTCQKNGIVFLVNYKGVSQELLDNLPTFRKRLLKLLFDCVPISVKASHVLFGDDCSWWQKIVVPGFSLLGRMTKMKAVVHFGSDEERMAKLKDHGISEDCVPVELGGTVTFDSWQHMLAERRKEGV